MTDAVEDFEEVAGGLEAQQSIAEWAAIEDFGFENGFAGECGKDEALTDGDLATGADERAPVVLARGLGEHDFDAASRFFAFAAESSSSVEAGRNDAAIVEDEEIAGAEEFRQGCEVRIAKRAGFTIHEEHAALAALGGWLLRDEFGRQIEIEVVNAQARCGLSCIAQDLGPPKYSSARSRAVSMLAFSSWRLDSNWPGRMSEAT